MKTTSTGEPQWLHGRCRNVFGNGVPNWTGRWTVVAESVEPVGERAEHWPAVLIGVLFAQGRRTASRWFTAAGVDDDWRDHDCFLTCLGRKAGRVATELLMIAMRWIPQAHVGDYVRLAIDDSPTKRYGPHVESAGQQQLRNVFSNVAAWHLRSATIS